MGFKENLREEMQFQDIKPKELSEKTGISINTLRNYINGHNALPNIYSAVKIANALNTSVEALIEESSSVTRENMTLSKKFLDIFSQLSENDRKSVIALMEEMKRH